MYRLEILQTQWVILSLAGGILTLLLILLAYMGMWRPRENEGLTEPQGTWRDAWRYMPWFLIFSFIATGLYNLIYVIIVSMYPPNW